MTSRPAGTAPAWPGASRRRTSRRPARSRTYDFGFNPQIPAGTIRDLTGLDFLSAGQSIILHGPVGVGKTMIAQALGQLACRRGHTVLFTKTSRLLADLSGGHADRTWHTRLRHWARPALLICDDFAMRDLTLPQADDLYELITERAGRSLIITSNRTPADWYPRARRGRRTIHARGHGRGGLGGRRPPPTRPWHRPPLPARRLGPPASRRPHRPERAVAQSGLTPRQAPRFGVRPDQIRVAGQWLFSDPSVPATIRPSVRIAKLIDVIDTLSILGLRARPAGLAPRFPGFVVCPPSPA